jgi:uncharacterized protein YjbJ (UPF0337 family)
MSANSRKIKAQALQARGNAKKAVGTVTDNDQLTASGRRDEAKGKAQAAVAGAGAKVNKLAKKITGK